MPSAPQRRARTGPHRWSVAVLWPLAVAGVVGCSAPREPAPEPYSPPTASSSVAVIEPGRPGEAASTTAPEDVVPDTRDERWVEADAVFFQQMVTHHRQAIEMSALAPERAGDPQVASLAERIGIGQQPEVDVMVSWLEDHGVEVPAERSWLTGRGPVDPEDPDDHAGHGGTAAASDMHGMATTDEVRRLADAEGEAFDALYVDLMVRHHEGAVAMVEDWGAEGVDVRVGEMADDVVAVQQAEIRHLEELRPR